MYVGGLHLGRMDSLRDIIAALGRLRLRGTKVFLDIFSPVEDLEKNRDYFSQHDKFVHIGSIGSHEVLEKLATADIMVYVESFVDHYSKYARLSFSDRKIVV